MVDSLRRSAQLTTIVEVDFTSIDVLGQRGNMRPGEELVGERVAPPPRFAFVAKAVVEALRAYPAFNASMADGGHEMAYHDAVHLGVATDTERGLLVATVRHAEDLSVEGLARRIAALADRTGQDALAADESHEATFTISHTGSLGALFGTPIVSLPAVAILDLGAVVRRPVVLTGPDGADTIAVRSMAYLSLTYDHRVVDGADAARFLGAVKIRLERSSADLLSR
jgi:pyruvate dehydrogenase E2 component (dihydrolipoamide acetyltransferase)